MQNSAISAGRENEPQIFGCLLSWDDRVVNNNPDEVQQSKHYEQTQQCDKDHEPDSWYCFHFLVAL